MKFNLSGWVAKIATGGDFTPPKCLQPHCSYSYYLKLALSIENVKKKKNLFYLLKYYFIYFTKSSNNILNIPVFIFKYNLIK